MNLEANINNKKVCALFFYYWVFLGYISWHAGTLGTLFSTSFIKYPPRENTFKIACQACQRAKRGFFHILL